MNPPALTQNQLRLHLRRHVGWHLYDESNIAPRGAAIYSLADPRDARELRYVGQTTGPRRRFLQHLNTARLWLPDETPWWVPSLKLRPLYAWIRELYRDGRRLPVMVISSWVDTPRARLRERERIFECLEHSVPLLNVEREILGRQMTLI